MWRALLSRGKDFFFRAFDIRVGEFRRMWLMQLNIFLLIQSLWIIKPISNALFLSRAGIDNLPLAFLLVALTAFGFSAAYSRLLIRIPLGSIMFRTYLISVLSLLIFGITLQQHWFRDWMSYVLYIGVALFGLITTSQFWILGNLVFNSLEAKRLFSFLGAGAIAGGISGGYLTSWLAPVLDSQNLLFVAAGLLVVTMIINQKIWVRFVPPFNREIRIQQSKSLPGFPLRLIRNSRHLTYLALIMGISVVAAKLVEFQFSAIASARIRDPEELTAFFGFWFSTANVLSLGIQLVVTQRVVAFLGVSRSLFVLPGALLAGATAVLYAPVLWAGTAMKVFDISLKQSINKAASELLIMPIPMAIKSQAKAFIDVFVDTTATGIGGILLILLINGFDLSVRAVAIMLLCLIGLWIYFIIRVRKEYVQAFQDKLGIPRKLDKAQTLELSDASVIKGIRRTLRSGTTNQILFLLDRIEESKAQHLMADVLPLLAHTSPDVRQAALRALYYHDDHAITSQIRPLLKDPDDDVRFRAFATLLAHTRQQRVAFIETHLNDPDPVIRGAALVGLATEARDNQVMQRLFKLETRLQKHIREALHISDPELAESAVIMVSRAIGYGKLTALYPVLKGYMGSDNPEVVRQAILAAGSTEDTAFIPQLLDLLPDTTTREAAQRALAKYEPDQLLPYLTEKMREKGLSHDICLQLPAIAESMDTQKAVDYLYELVRYPDTAVKRKALETLHKTRVKFPHLTIGDKRIMPILMEEAGLYRDTLGIFYAARHHWERQAEDPAIRETRDELIQLLERKLDSILERIFWILGLRYPPGIILPLWKDIHHEDPNVRINTVELLDNILEPAMKRVVIPIVETAVTGSLSEDILVRLELTVPTETSCFESLLRGDDDQLKIAVLNMIEALNQPEYADLVRIAAGDDHARVRGVAERILGKA